MVRRGSLCALNLGVQVYILWIGKTWGRRGRKHSKLKKLKFHWQRTRSEMNSILGMVKLMYVFVLVNTQHPANITASYGHFLDFLSFFGKQGSDQNIVKRNVLLV